LVVAYPWLLETLTRYTTQIFLTIPSVVR